MNIFLQVPIQGSLPVPPTALHQHEVFYDIFHRVTVGDTPKLNLGQQFFKVTEEEGQTYQPTVLDLIQCGSKNNIYIP